MDAVIFSNIKFDKKESRMMGSEDTFLMFLGRMWLKSNLYASSARFVDLHSVRLYKATSRHTHNK